MPANKKLDDEREFSVGERVTVRLSSGRVVDAIVKAVINQTDGVRLRVDYGKDETALVYLWRERDRRQPPNRVHLLTSAPY